MTSSIPTRGVMTSKSKRLSLIPFHILHQVVPKQVAICNKYTAGNTGLALYSPPCVVVPQRTIHVPQNDWTILNPGGPLVVELTCCCAPSKILLITGRGGWMKYDDRNESFIIVLSDCLKRHEIRRKFTCIRVGVKMISSPIK